MSTKRKRGGGRQVVDVEQRSSKRKNCFSGESEPQPQAAASAAPTVEGMEATLKCLADAANAGGFEVPEAKALQLIQGGHKAKALELVTDKEVFSQQLVAMSTFEMVPAAAPFSRKVSVGHQSGHYIPPTY